MGEWDGEPQFIDAESNYSSSKDEVLSQKAIMMNSVQQIMNLGSKEMRGGYWKEEASKNERGVTIVKKIYEPDTREVCCNAINMLKILLLAKLDNEKNKRPEFQEIKKEINKTIKQIDGAKKECLGRTEKQDTELLPTEHYGSSDREVIETYKYKNLTLHLRLFELLNKYMNFKNYFVSSGLEE